MNLHLTHFVCSPGATGVWRRPCVSQYTLLLGLISLPPELLHIIYVDDNMFGAARLLASAAACRGSSPLQAYGGKGRAILLNPILVKRDGKAKVSIRKQTSFFCSISEILSSLQLFHLFSDDNIKWHLCLEDCLCLWQVYVHRWSISRISSFSKDK